MTAANGAGEGHGASVQAGRGPAVPARHAAVHGRPAQPGRALRRVRALGLRPRQDQRRSTRPRRPAMPGVVGVYTAADLNLEPFPTAGPPVDTPEEMRRPVLAKDVVRFTGEPVAVVVAETRGAGGGRGRARRRRLRGPAGRCVDMTKALDDDAPKLFPDAPNGNLAAAGPTGEDALADAEVRVGARLRQPADRRRADGAERRAGRARPGRPAASSCTRRARARTPTRARSAASTGHREGEAARRLDRDRRRLRRAHRVLPGADRRRRARARARQAPSATSRRARRRCSRCSTAARRCRTSRSAARATARSPG